MISPVSSGLAPQDTTNSPHRCPIYARSQSSLHPIENDPAAPCGQPRVDHGDGVARLCFGPRSAHAIRARPSARCARGQNNDLENHARVAARPGRLDFRQQSGDRGHACFPRDPRTGRECQTLCLRERRRAPRPLSRLVAVVWMLGGIGLTSYITATLLKLQTGGESGKLEDTWFDKPATE